MQVNMHEAKTHLSKLGEKAWQGERVIIAKAGNPFLDLLPHRCERKERKPGRLKEEIEFVTSFSSLESGE